MQSYASQGEITPSQGTCCGCCALMAIGPAQTERGWSPTNNAHGAPTMNHTQGKQMSQGMSGQWHSGAGTAFLLAHRSTPCTSWEFSRDIPGMGGWTGTPLLSTQWEVQGDGSHQRFSTVTPQKGAQGPLQTPGETVSRSRGHPVCTLEDKDTVTEQGTQGQREVQPSRERGHRGTEACSIL